MANKAKPLGLLKGIIASAREKSRNKRTYTEGFWDSKFNSDLFKEGLDNKMFFGQLYHPDTDEEYSQIHCDDRSAVVLTDVKKKGLDYEGIFEILPTKAGQCLRNLLDIGCIFGISSRGLSDYDVDVYDESIAPNYDLITWDVVAFPGIKSCRLHEITPVSESLKYKTNKTKIMENLQNIANNDKYMECYINDALKMKEDYNQDLQIEDIMAKYGISDDLYSYGYYVRFDEDGLPYFDDNEHGKAVVITNYPDKIQDFDSGDIVMVDDITYDEGRGNYIAFGDWIKIN